MKNTFSVVDLFVKARGALITPKFLFGTSTPPLPSQPVETIEQWLNSEYERAKSLSLSPPERMALTLIESTLAQRRAFIGPTRASITALCRSNRRFSPRNRQVDDHAYAPALRLLVQIGIWTPFREVKSQREQQIFRIISPDLLEMMRLTPDEIAAQEAQIDELFKRRDQRRQRSTKRKVTEQIISSAPIEQPVAQQTKSPIEIGCAFGSYGKWTQEEEAQLEAECALEDSEKEEDREMRELLECREADLDAEMTLAEADFRGCTRHKPGSHEFNSALSVHLNYMRDHWIEEHLMPETRTQRFDRLTSELDDPGKRRKVLSWVFGHSGAGDGPQLTTLIHEDVLPFFWDFSSEDEPLFRWVELDGRLLICDVGGFHEVNGFCIHPTHYCLALGMKPYVSWADDPSAMWQAVHKEVEYLDECHNLAYISRKSFHMLAIRTHELFPSTLPDFRTVDLRLCPALAQALYGKTQPKLELDREFESEQLKFDSALWSWFLIRPPELENAPIEQLYMVPPSSREQLSFPGFDDSSPLNDLTLPALEESGHCRKVSKG